MSNIWRRQPSGKLRTSMLSTRGSTTKTIAETYFEVPPAFAILKVWTGAAWVQKVLKRWSGTAWVATTLKVYSGGAWQSVDSDGV